MGQLSINLSFDRPTGNFWVDTGLVVLLRHFGEGEHSVEEVRKWLVNQLAQPSGNKGKYYDLNSGQFREYDKVNWLYPTNLFIKVSGSAPKTEVEIEGKKEKVLTSPPTFDLNLRFGTRIGTCDLCGDRASLTDAKMWMYPFVVDPSKFGTFYSGAKRALRLCPRCALAGMAGYLGWLWKAQNNESLHFFVFHSDLREMKRLQDEVLEPLRLKGNQGGTAPVAFAGPYTHETVWGLILKLFTHVRNSDLLTKEARDLLASILGATEAEFPPTSITLYAVTGKPGKAFSTRALREFSKFQQLYRFYESWIEIIAKANIDISPHQRLTRIFEQFWVQRGQNRETIWRDKIAHAILEFLDPSPFVEQFLFEARAKEENPRPLVRGTLEVLGKYLQEVFGMDEQFQRVLARFGYSLGAAAQEHKEMGLLYALRNARNPEDFYRVLNDVQFRLEMYVPEALLRIEKGERISGVSWIRVKTLLSIYAMNAYLRKDTPQPGV